MRKRDIHIERPPLITKIDYQREEFAKKVTVDSIPYAELNFFADDVFILKDDEFTYRFIYYRYPEDVVNVSERFNVHEWDPIISEPTSNVNIKDDEFEYDIFLAVRIADSSEIIARESFDYRVIDKINITEGEEVGLEDSLVVTIYEAIRRNTSNKFNLSEEFSSRVVEEFNIASSDEFSLLEEFSHREVLDYNRNTLSNVNLEDTLTYNIQRITVPQDLVVTADNTNCLVNINWNHPTSGPPDTYEIEVIAPAGTVTYTTNGSNTSYSVNGGVYGDGQYQARVRGLSNNGLEGPWTSYQSTFLTC